MAEPQRVFSAEMLRTLQIQMHIHVQMLVQGMVVAACSIRTHPAPPAVRMAACQLAYDE